MTIASSSSATARGPSNTTVASTKPLTVLQPPVQSYLPTELIQEILSYLSPSDYDSARLVCQRWYEASLCKPLLLNLLSAMKFDPVNNGCPCFDKPSFYTSQPPTPSCPETCLCNYQFPEDPIIMWDLKSLRMAFALALDKWPSKVRVACSKLVLDMTTFLGNYNADWGYSGGLREVESLCFSDRSGSFVATVTKAIGKHGEVERKLWIHRLFSSRHSPFSNFARPNDGFLFFVEGSRCLPGQLYMTMELSKFPGIPVVGLRIEEHSALSAVKKIAIKYINDKEEEITFSKFKPDKQSPANKDTVFYDRKGITYRSNYSPWSVKQKTKGKGMVVGKPKGRGINLWKKDLVFHKDTVIYAGPQKRISPTSVRTSQRLLAIIDDEPLHQMCFRITAPLSPSCDGEYCSIIVTPSNDIFICSTFPNTPGPIAPNPEIVHARYKFSVPPRATELARPKITHITVAPQYYYDCGRGFWWMAICAAYDNGEIWMWRVDMEVLLRKEGMNATDTSNSKHSARDELPLVRVPEKVLVTTNNQATTLGALSPYVPQRRPGDFDAEVGECIAVNLCSFSGRTLGESTGSATKIVKVVLPSPVKETDGFGYVRALKLGYMPGLEALNFVGRGMTVLAGTRKEIVVWDMRVWNGFEKGKLKAEF